MYKLSCNHLVVFYIAENKTLAGNEDRTYEAEVAGDKTAIVLFDYLREVEGCVKRVNADTMALKHELLTTAELLLIVAGRVVPPDHGGTVA